MNHLLRGPLPGFGCASLGVSHGGLLVAWLPLLFCGHQPWAERLVVSLSSILHRLLIRRPTLLLTELLAKCWRTYCAKKSCTKQTGKLPFLEGLA
jgi:hypothetical protein